MIFVYYCYGSAHSSILAANIHIGELQSNSVVSHKNIETLPYFDCMLDESVGMPIFCGTDFAGNCVYALGTKSAGQAVVMTISSTLENMGVKNCFVFTDTLHLINIWTRLGGFLSRQLGVISLGRSLAAWGLKKELDSFFDLVNKTQKSAYKNSLDSDIELPDNES